MWPLFIQRGTKQATFSFPPTADLEFVLSFLAEQVLYLPPGISLQCPTPLDISQVTESNPLLVEIAPPLPTERTIAVSPVGGSQPTLILAFAEAATIGDARTRLSGILGCDRSALRLSSDSVVIPDSIDGSALCGLAEALPIVVEVLVRLEFYGIAPLVLLLEKTKTLADVQKELEPIVAYPIKGFGNPQSRGASTPLRLTESVARLAELGVKILEVYRELYILAKDRKFPITFPACEPSADVRGRCLALAKLELGDLLFATVHRVLTDNEPVPPDTKELFLMDPTLDVTVVCPDRSRPTLRLNSCDTFAEIRRRASVPPHLVTWDFTVIQEPIFDETLLVGPTLKRKYTNILTVLPAQIIVFVKVRNRAFRMIIPADAAAEAQFATLQTTVKNRFSFDEASASWKSLSGHPIPPGSLKATGRTARDPVCFDARGAILQRINLFGFEDQGAITSIEFPLDATVSDLLAKMGGGRYQFSSNSEPIYCDGPDLLADYAITNDPIQVSKVQKQTAPKLIAGLSPGRGLSSSTPPISCEVVLPDGEPVTVPVSPTATVSTVIDKLSARFGGAAPIVLSDDDQPIPLDCPVRDLKEPRTLWTHLPGPPATSTAPTAQPVAGPAAKPSSSSAAGPATQPAAEAAEETLVHLEFHGHTIQFPVNRRATAAGLRARLASLGDPGVTTIRRGGVVVSDRDRLYPGDASHPPVIVTIGGSLPSADSNPIPVKPPNYAERLDLVRRITGCEDRQSRRFLKFHRYDAIMTLCDLLIDSSA
jgi:hypothetical protein